MSADQEFRFADRLRRYLTVVAKQDKFPTVGCSYHLQGYDIIRHGGELVIKDGLEQRKVFQFLEFVDGESYVEVWEGYGDMIDELTPILEKALVLEELADL